MSDLDAPPKPPVDPVEWVSGAYFRYAIHEDSADSGWHDGTLIVRSVVGNLAKDVTALEGFISAQAGEFESAMAYRQKRIDALMDIANEALVSREVTEEEIRARIKVESKEQ